MITAGPATRTKTAPRHGRPPERESDRFTPDPAPDAGGGERWQRRLERRRRNREQLLVLLVLVVALAATVVILGLQWLDSPAPTTSSASAVVFTINHGGPG